MVKCAICGCNCDPSDLVSGICDECREYQKKVSGRSGTKRLFVASNSGQMEILEAGVWSGRK